MWPGPGALKLLASLIWLSLRTFPGKSVTMKHNPLFWTVLFDVMLFLDLIGLFNCVLQYLQQQKQHPLQHYALFLSPHKGPKLHFRTPPLLPRLLFVSNKFYILYFSYTIFIKLNLLLVGGIFYWCVFRIFLWFFLLLQI